MGKREKSERPKPTRQITPGGIVLRAFLLASILWFFVPWFWNLLTVSGCGFFDGTPASAERQLASLHRRLETGEPGFMQKLHPEGRLFCHSFYGFSVVNVAVSTTPGSDLRRWAVRELEWVIASAEECAGMDEFPRFTTLRPKGGIIPAAQANLLRAGYVLLGGKREDIIREFHDVSGLLFAEFMKTQTGSLETFPRMVWPVDNSCALESLRLHDVLFGTTYSRACRKWERWMAEHLDARTGMMVARITKDGRVVDDPRGCALSWSLAFMPGYAPGLARSQYAAYRKRWFVHVLATTGVREYPEGREVIMDCDTGPVVCGIGAAASAFGIAAARANGDREAFGRMLRGLEASAMPSWSLAGAKRYFFGKFLLADVLAFWAKTVRVWDKPGREQSWDFAPIQTGGGWWVVVLCAGLLSAGAALLGCIPVRRAVRAVRCGNCIWDKRARLILAVQCAVLFAWVALSLFSWLVALVLLAVVTAVEERLLPLMNNREAQA